MSKTVVITEEMNNAINDMLAMTQFKFKANIRKFLAALLEDPNGAEPGVIFTHNGIDKNKLIKALVDNRVITKKMVIDDHDADGNPHTARMIVRYSVPKERFNERLDALYDVLFPNVDAKINESLFETDPYQDALRVAKASPLTMGVVSGGVNCKLSPEYGMGKFFDDAANALNKKIKDNKLDEEGGGATNCASSGQFTAVPAFSGVIGKEKKGKNKVGGNPYTLTDNQLINESAVDRFIDKMIFSRLPEQLKQYVNTPVNDLLAKRPDLVNAQSLGATEAELAQLGGYPLKDFIRLSINKMFDIGHGKGPKKYLKGIFRIVLDELNYLQHPDQNAIQNLKNDVMYIMQASENGSDPDAMKLDGNLNGLNAGQLHNLFKNKRKAFAQGLRDKVSSMFNGGRSDYKVVPILKHEDAVKFQPYTSWCITYDSSANYDQYVQGGRRFYIFLKNGFEKIPKQTGQNCPMDEYGLSMISILVDMEGNIDYITTRWNHDHDGEYHNPDAETVQAFQNVIGMNLYDVCKPYTREELHAMGITPFDEVPALLAQGVPLQKIFDTVGDFVNGFAWVELNGKIMQIDTQGKLYDYDSRERMVSESLVDIIVNKIISEAVTGEDAEKAAAIYAYCLDDNEEDYCILCAKRLEGDEKGKWNPPMGHLHVGESPKDGAVRECEEESGVKIPKSKLQVGSYEDWGRNYWVILDGTVKDWPVGKGDGENSKFEWKNVYGLFWGKDKDLEWAWNTKDFVYKFAPAELDLDESVHHKIKILNEGYWGHLPLENDSALDEFGEVAYNNIEEQLKNIDKAWGDKLSVFTYLGVIMYMLQIYNFFYSLKSLDEKFDFTNRINKVIKYLDDEKFINGWKNPDEIKKYIKKLPDTIKEILDKNSLGSDNFKKLKVTVSCNEGKNYVNMNVDVREGGRSAVKMSVEDFKQEMIHAYHQYAMEQEQKYKGELQLTPTPGNFVYSLCYKRRDNEKSKYAKALYDDIWGGKYKFDTENVDACGGIKMSKKGFPYIQCDAGGDWECPVCFFVYFDGNKFRGYVPLKGNALNRNEKHAFSGCGNEPDAKFVQNELGLSYEEADHMCDDIDYNVDACLEDFLSRVDVKGTYKKRDFTKDEEEFKKYRKEKIADEDRRRAEAERNRQMNAQCDIEGLNDDEADINEATATGTGGLPGEFTMPFPMDKDDPSLDRTPGDTIGMHDRVGNVKLEEKRKKAVKNDEGEVVPEFCKKCGEKVGLYIQGEPIYKCSKCGEYYGTMPFTLHRKKKKTNESKQTWRDNPLFTIGKYKDLEKAKIIQADPDYCLWLYRNTLMKINNCPFSSAELAMLDVSYYKKHKVFPIRSIYTPKYAKINGKYVSQMSKEELEYVYKNGSEEFKWLVKQEHKNRGWEKKNWTRPAGASAFQSDDVGDESWMYNNR